MEVAAMNACREVFPKSQVTSCYFHFANIMDNVKLKGLRDVYVNQDQCGFYDWIRTFIGSALLPRAAFTDRWYPELENDIPDESNETESCLIATIAEYIRSYWVPSRSIWEQYENDGPRTTNPGRRLA